MASRVTQNKSQSHVMDHRASVIWTPTIFLKSSLPLSSHPPPWLHLPPCYSSSNQIYFYFALGSFSTSSTKTSPTLNIEDKRQIYPTYLPSKSLLVPLQCLQDSVEMSPHWRDLPWPLIVRVPILHHYPTSLSCYVVYFPYNLKQLS